MADDPLDRSRAYAAAGVLFFDNAHRILLVQPTYKDHWDIPGGYVETGETPVQAAAREVREELGIEAAVGPLLVADWAPHPDEGDKLLLIFDGGTLTADQRHAIRLQADELASYAFRDPADADHLADPTPWSPGSGRNRCSPGRPHHIPRMRRSTRLLAIHSGTRGPLRFQGIASTALDGDRRRSTHGPAARRSRSIR